MSTLADTRPTPAADLLHIERWNDPLTTAVFDSDTDEALMFLAPVLGPTSTNWERPYEYEVPWEQFLACWWAQGNDGQAIGERGSFKG